jgi:hypothetical protein
VTVFVYNFKTDDYGIVHDDGFAALVTSACRSARQYKSFTDAISSLVKDGWSIINGVSAMEHILGMRHFEEVGDEAESYGHTIVRQLLEGKYSLETRLDHCNRRWNRVPAS